MFTIFKMKVLFKTKESAKAVGDLQDMAVTTLQSPVISANLPIQRFLVAPDATLANNALHDQKTGSG